MTRRADIPSTERGLTHVVTRTGKVERRYIEGSGALNLYGYGSLDLAVTNPGSLLFRYKAGEASGDLLDTSGYSGGPHPASYFENTSGVDPADSSGWVAGNAATRAVVDHSEFGSEDDGCVRFNFKQKHAPPAGPFIVSGTYSSIDYPGAYFKSGSSSIYNFATSGDHLKSISFFMNPKSGMLVRGGVIGTGRFDNTQFDGWAFILNTDYTLSFYSTHGGGSGTLLMTSPGALIADSWYHVVVTWDGTTWSMYLNGVLAATATDSTAPQSSTVLQIGKVQCYGNAVGPSTADAFFYGQLDEITGYSVVLTLDQIQAIYAARDASSFDSTTTQIRLGSSATPFALSSKISDTLAATNGWVATADGANGTVWQMPSGTRVAAAAGNPSSTAGFSNGDLYLNTTDGELWQMVAGSWADQGVSFKGADGTDGVSPVRKLLMTWAGLVPLSIGQGVILEVPYDSDGSSFAFTLTRIVARMEQTFTSDQTFLIQKAAGGDVAFASPTNIGSVTIAAGHYRDVTTGLSFVVNSGDLIGIYYSAAGADVPYSVQLEGTA